MICKSLMAQNDEKLFKIPLKLCLVRKIGHPFNDEYAIGAVTENDLLLNQAENPDSIHLDASIQKEKERLHVLVMLLVIIKKK